MCSPHLSPGGNSKSCGRFSPTPTVWKVIEWGISSASGPLSSLPSHKNLHDSFHTVIQLYLFPTRFKATAVGETNMWETEPQPSEFMIEYKSSCKKGKLLKEVESHHLCVMVDEETCQLVWKIDEIQESKDGKTEKHPEWKEGVSKEQRQERSEWRNDW